MPNSVFGFSYYHLRLLIFLFLIMVVGIFDFLIFWDFSEMLTTTFFGSHQNDLMAWIWVVGLFSTGYLSRPFGGYLLGKFADNAGRKPAFFYSLFGISLFTLIIGILPSYQSIGMAASIIFIIARIGQGMCFGAMVPIAWVYSTESLPLRQIGLGAGVICSGAAFGMLCIGSANIILSERLSEADLITYGFRLPFIIGAMAGFILLISQKLFNETPIFIKKISENQNDSIIDDAHVEFTDAKRPFKNILSLIMLSWFIVSIVIFNILLVPLLNIGFINNGSDFFSIGVLLGLFFYALGCLFFGIMTDRILVTKSMCIGCLGLTLSAWAFFSDYNAGGNLSLLFLALMGFFSGVMATVPAVMVRITSFKHRALTLGVIYNTVSALLGASMPLLLGWATYFIGYAPVLYLTSVCILTVFFAFILHYVPRSEKQIYN